MLKGIMAPDFEKWFKETLDDINLVAIMLDTSGRVQLLNKLSLKMIGRDIDSVTGQDWFDTFIPDEKERSESKEFFEKIISGEQNPSTRCEHKISTRGKAVHTIVMNHSLVRGNDGAIKGVFCIGEDITEKARMEDELRRMNAFLEKTLDSATNSIFVMDTEGRFTLLNKAGARMVGYGVDELIGRNFTEVIAPEKLPEIMDMFKKAVEDGVVYSDIETVLVKKDGQRRTIRFSAGPLEMDGEVKSIAGAAEDITEWRRAEEESENRNRFLRNVLESLKLPLYVINVEDYTIQMANSAAGIDMTLVGEGRCYEVVHKRDTPCEINGSLCPVVEIKKTKKAVTAKHVHYSEDSGERIIEVHGYPIMNDAGDVVQIIEYTMDVTDRETADRELRKSRRGYIDIIENVEEAIVEINDKGTISIWNKAAERMFGYTAFEAIGDNLTIIIPPELRERHREGLLKAVATGEGEHIGKPVELEGLKKGGGRFPVELLISLTSGEEGGRRFTGILRDLTEQKKNRERLIRAESLGAVGTFISGVAHELNNPLTAILGFSESVLKDHDFPADVGEELEMVVSEARRSVGIVRGLLNFVRKQPTSKSSVNINEVIKSVIRLKSYQLKIENIELVTKLGEPPPHVLGDAGQLRQVVLNLLQNAHHAIQDTNEPGRISISSHESEGIVRIEMYNSGYPIQPHIMKSIFEPFFTTKKGDRGTGLGLAISYGIAKDHSGDLSVRNVEDGVVFTLSLPTYKAEKEKERLKAELKAPKGKGKTALIVDDEKAVRSLVQKYLKKMGFAVEVAENGRDALRVLEERAVDIALIDLLMPGLDGFGVYNSIKERWPSLLGKIIFTTGMIDEKAARFAVENKLDILEKPFEKERLYEAISAILEPERSRA